MEQLYTVLCSNSASVASVSSVEENSGVSSRRKWNEEKLAEVYTAFKQSIESGQVTIEYVREVIADNAILKNIPLTSVRDNVRSLIKASQETQDVSKGAATHPSTQLETPADKLRRFGFVSDESRETAQNEITFVDNADIASVKTNTETSLKSGRAFNDEQTLTSLLKGLTETNAPIERPAPGSRRYFVRLKVIQESASF